MNKKVIIAGIIIALLFAYNKLTHSEMGCMEKSLFLTEKYDPKVWHYVRCNCPCEKYIAQLTRLMPLDKCPMCKHIHIPKTPIIVTKAVRQAAMQKVHKTSPVAFEDANEALAYLIEQKRMR